MQVKAIPVGFQRDDLCAVLLSFVKSTMTLIHHIMEVHLQPKFFCTRGAILTHLYTLDGHVQKKH